MRLPLAAGRSGDLAAPLHALAGALNETTRRTEPDFLKLGSDLKELYRCAADLGRATSGHVNAVRDALQSSRLSGPDGLAARSLDDLQGGITEAARSLESLAGVASDLARLQGQGRQMQRIAMFLKASGCSFAVESARSVSCQQAFGAFVEELRQLAEKISELGLVIHDQSANTRSELGRFNQAIAAGLEKLRQLARQSDATVRQTSGQMQHLLDSAWSALQQAEAHTREINRHANDAVFHLQFGDILRQKLEHVISALEDAARKSGEGGSAGRSAAAQILAIQVGQLELIEAEILSTRTQLAGAFAGLAEETQRVLGNVRTIEGEGGSRAGAGRNLFDNLKTDLLQLDALQSQGRELCGQSSATSARAVEASAQLARHLDQVREINREMHLQALNAIIKTALLGDEGQTLGVLSMHVHTVFQESTGLVNDTVGVLEQVTAHTHGSTGGKVAGSTNQGGLQAGLEQLSRVHAGFQEAIASATSLAAEQETRLTAARQRLDFLAELAGQIGSFRKQIAALNQGLPAAATEQLSAEALAARYTMESEREVHRRLAGSPAAVAAVTAGTTVVSSGVASSAVPSAPDDNMEFFDAPSPAPVTAAAPTPALPAAATKGALSTVSAPHVPAPKAEDLGDNIELF